MGKVDGALVVLVQVAVVTQGYPGLGTLLTKQKQDRYEFRKMFVV